MIKYRADIDGLRAIAVLSVVAFHAFPGSITILGLNIFPFGGGFIGVDVFFVISGYLITSLILKPASTNSFSIVDFYRRRILRIFPALMMVMLSLLLFGYFVMLAPEYAALGKHTMFGASFLANIGYWFEDSYFVADAATKPLQHLWSLGVEEQYYLFWPVIVILALNRFDIFKLTLFFIGSSFLFNIYLVFIQDDLTQAFYSPFPRFWELLIGSLLAIYFFKKKIDPRGGLSTNRNVNNSISVLGVFFLAIGYMLIREETLFPGMLALLPVIGSMLIIAAGSEGWFNRRVLAMPILVWFGLISYPLYLWHWPIFSFLRIFAGPSGEVSDEIMLAAVALSIFLAWATYRFLEKPIRFGSKDSKNFKAVGLASMIFFIGISGFWVYQKDGNVNYSASIPDSLQILLEPYPHQRFNDNCDAVYPGWSDNSWACMLSKSEVASVALIGDSHANMYYESLAKHLPQRSVLNISGCKMPIMSKKHLEVCSDYQSDVLKLLINSEEIKTVYLTGYFSYLASGSFKYGNIEGRRVAAELESSDRDSFIKNGKFVLSKLLAAKKNIVIIKDIPDAVIRPMDCLYKEDELIWRFRSNNTEGISRFENQNGDQFCSISATEYRDRISPFNQALSKIVEEFSDEITVFDPTSLFCDEINCYLIKNTVPLYFDSDHLTPSGSRIVIDALMGMPSTSG